MPKKMTLYDGDEAVYPRTLASEVYVSDGVTFEDLIKDSLALVEEAEQILIDGDKIYKTYTVRIDLNNSDPETSCTYMDDAIGMTPGYDGWKNESIIQNIKPCILNNGEVAYYLQKDNYNLREDGSESHLDGIDGDVMVEIPKIGYKLWNDDNYQYVSITENPYKNGYCYYAHSLDSVGDCDKIYYGAYYGYVDTNTMQLYSRSNVSPITNMSLINFRDCTATRGTGYSIESFFPRTLVQCLYAVVYKNLNGQSALGSGWTSGNRVSHSTGSTNSNTFCYGTTSGSEAIKLFGIEDFWGNIWGWLDGAYVDSFRNIKTDYRNSIFTDSDGNSFQFSTSSGATGNYYGYINKIMGTNISGFVKDYNNNTEGTAITYYSDYSDVYADCFGICGGNWSRSSIAGPFCLDLNCGSSTASSNLGARLLYKYKSN